MKTIQYPKKELWAELAKRPVQKKENLTALVNEVFEAIRKNGDQALKKYAAKFDGISLNEFSVSKSEITASKKQLSKELKKAIATAQENIYKFHSSQKEKSKKINTMPGVTCWRESRAIEKVGIYIPGGTAPLFSTVLMLGIPAKLAGCKEIILCTPPDKNGKINPAILYTARLIGITKIFAIGGIQAIGAMTFGTESIPAVYKIFGPGNQFVTAAKQVAQNYGVAIDMPAGPSEVMIIADKTAQPEFVAADLLSQAEHGEDSQVILLSDDAKIIGQTIKELEQQKLQLPRLNYVEKALQNSKAILLKNKKECLVFSNQYAPEHLILALKYTERDLLQITNAGSVFLGNYSCESAGDYASGTNHTLPTNGYARSYSGVSLDSFIKKITFQKITEKGIQQIGNTIEEMAKAENLLAHKNAVTLRLNKIAKKK